MNTACCLFWLIGAPLAALIASILCRRHDVLLRVGSGLLAGSVGGCLLIMYPAGPLHTYVATLLALAVGVALLAFILRRQHDMLPWLGGGIVVASVGWVSMLIDPAVLGWPLLNCLSMLTLPLPVAVGLILLTGGLIRWGLTSRRGWNALAAATAEAGDGSPPGYPSAHRGV